MLDEHVLRRRGAALHAVEHDGVGPGLDGQRDIVIGPRGADLDVDRLFPIGDLAQLLDLDFEIVRPGPVGMAAGRALVDALRQRAHLGDALGDLLPEQHAAAAGLGALPDDDLDRIRLAQVVGVHAVARRQHLVDEDLANARAPPASCRRRRSWSRCRPRVAPRPSASLACADSAPKLMPAMVIGILSSIGFLAKRVPSMTSVAHFSR